MGVVKAHEPVRIQPFAAEFAVERLNERIIRHVALGVFVSRTDLMVYAQIIRVTGHREHASAGKAVVLT